VLFDEYFIVVQQFAVVFYRSQIGRRKIGNFHW